MYRTILIPTDGSALSRQAVTSGVLFARNHDAAVIGIHVTPVPHDEQLQAWMHHDPHYEERRQALFDKFADEYLAFVANSALAEGVPCTCRKVKASEPGLAIAQAAEHARCDLIYMASHGWKGERAQILGSETLKVLHYSRVPVLVYKPGRERAPAAGKK
ncbi:MAG: universal stress protein [Burkholderiaceae bacterium]|jgi:nucleotide-binding universal stress UspA family protein